MYLDSLYLPPPPPKKKKEKEKKSASERVKNTTMDAILDIDSVNIALGTASIIYIIYLVALIYAWLCDARDQSKQFVHNYITHSGPKIAALDKGYSYTINHFI